VSAIAVTALAHRKGMQPALVVVVLAAAIDARRSADDKIDETDTGELDDEVVRRELERLDFEEAAAAAHSE
jgi:hypothetical protein